jgi:hypothetical protein
VTINFGDLVEIQPLAERAGQHGEVVGITHIENGVSQTKYDVQFQDGPTLTYLPHQVQGRGSWEVEIEWPWRVVASPYGTGLALLVDRGIPCADNTQVVNAHTTNCIGYWSALRVVERLRPALQKQIDAFVGFVRTIEHGSFNDTVGLLFMQHLLSQVAGECEKEPS